MEFNFSLPRLLLLAGLIGFFWWLGGFTEPHLGARGDYDLHRVSKAWAYCMLLFLWGAGCVSIVDHYVGNIERMNIRLIYIVLGMTLMIGSLLWIKNLKQVVAAATRDRSAAMEKGE